MARALGPPEAEPYAPTLTERLTAAFYAWEQRGRGWATWPYPVQLEPPFRSPFLALPPGAGPGMPDDGRKPTLLSSLADRLRGRRQETAASGDSTIGLWEPEPELFEGADWPVRVVSLSFPAGTGVRLDAAEAFLVSLSACRHPIAFEVVGLPDRIQFQLTPREEDAPLARRQLAAYFPDAEISEDDDFLTGRWQETGGCPSLVIDFGLSQEFMRPLRMARSLEPDPLVAVVGALSELGDKEIGVLQVLFLPARGPWTEGILASVTDGEGGSFFADAPDMVRLAREKVARPLYAALVRVAARSPSEERIWEIARGLGGALRQLANPASNELIPLSEDAYDPVLREEDLLLRQSRRSGMLLNTAELVSLVHPPSASVRSEKLRRRRTRTKRAPTALTGPGLILGENVAGGTETSVALSPELRLRHMHIVGASGTGKSHLLLSLILQDLEAGAGLAVLDPHGDLIERVLERVPEDRLDDVVLFDPADPERVVGFNVLEAHSDLERDLLASDLTAVFRRLATSWGDQMTAVLSNAVLAFLASEEGGTLADLRRFLVDPAERRAFLRRVRDPEVVYFWEKEFPLLSGRPQAPILTRLNAFLRHRLVRDVVAQPSGGLDVAGVMEGGRILLAKLAQGQIGEENAYLLGSLLLSRFHELALARQEQEAAARRPFYLYVDEFHHFATPSMTAILAGARKYRLGLVLAHQDLEQLRGRDAGLLAAVLTNPATRICFRVGDQDARKLAEGFSSFDATDLQQLGVGEAICRVERADWDFNLRTSALPPLDPAAARAQSARARARSRARYGTDRTEVEEALRRFAPAPKEAAARPQAAEERPEAPEAGHRPSERPRAAQGTPAPSVREAPEPPPVPATSGRGGPQHTYLQELISRWAKAHGWHTTLEQPVLDGLGAVDVALEREELRVACEITVTTGLEHELANVQKCLAAGFTSVVVVSAERKHLAAVRRHTEAKLDEAQREKVQFLTPEELFSFLTELETEAASGEQTVRGYRVRLRYQAVEPEEQEARRKAISKVVLEAVKRLRGKDA